MAESTMRCPAIADDWLAGAAEEEEADWEDVAELLAVLAAALEDSLADDALADDALALAELAALVTERLLVAEADPEAEPLPVAEQPAA